MAKILLLLFTLFLSTYHSFAQSYEGRIENCEYCNEWHKPPLYVHLSFKNNNGQITGSYYYKHVGNDIQIKGKEQGDSLLLQEFNNGKITGHFHAKKVKNELKGFWISADKKTQFPFFATLDKYPTDFKVIRKVKEQSVKCGHCRSTALYLIGDFSQETKNTFASNYDFRECDIEEDTCWCDKGLSTNTIKDADFDNPFFICVAIWRSDYLCGAGANNDFRYSLFDLTQGKTIGLKEVLTDEGVEQIRLWINSEIREYFDGNEFYLERYPIQKNEIFRLNEFYFTEEGISFFLAAPGAVTNIIQMEDISFSYDQIKSYLKKNNGVYQFIESR